MRPERPWRLEPTLRFLATLLLLFAAAGLGWHGILSAFGVDPTRQAPWQLSCGTGLLHVAGLIALMPLLRTHQLNWVSAFGFFASPRLPTLKLTVKLTIPVLIIASATHFGSVRLLEAVGIETPNQSAVDAVMGTTRTWERLLLLFFAAVSAPVFEEVVFRGVLWPFARDHGFRISGILLVSLPFALIHANLAATLPLVLLSIFWCWLYDRTGDLSAPILSHSLFNAISFGLLLLSPPTVPPS